MITIPMPNETVSVLRERGGGGETKAKTAIGREWIKSI